MLRRFLRTAATQKRLTNSNLMRISEKEFIGKILRYRAFEIDDKDILKGVGNISNTKSLLTCNGRLYLQISDRNSKLKDQVKSKMIETAKKQFCELKNVGKGGEDLRGFLLGGFSNRIYSPGMMRELIEESLLVYTPEDFKKISTHNLITIIESCVFNGMINSSELNFLMQHFLLNLSRAGAEKFYMLSKGLLVFSYFVKVNGKMDKDSGSIFQGFFKIYLSMIDQANPKECLMVYESITQFQSIYKLLPSENPFIEPINLEFERYLTRNQEDIRIHLINANEQVLLPTMKRLNSVNVTEVFSSKTTNDILTTTLLFRTKNEDLKTSSSFISNAMGIALKTNKNTKLQKEILDKIELDFENAVETLENIEIILELISLQEMNDEFLDFLTKTDQFLVQFLNSKKLTSNKSNIRSLVQIFQTLVRMNRGSTHFFSNFFKIMADKKKLDYLGPIPLFVKFLPSLGVKTKKLSGAVTNQNADSSANILKFNKQSDKMEQVKENLKSVWRVLDSYLVNKIDYIELDKISSVLIHFVYGQTVVKDLKIFRKSLKRLEGNFDKIGVRQLAQTLYSLSRIQVKDAMNALVEGLRIFVKKTEGKEGLSIEKVNVAWACSHGGACDYGLMMKLFRDEQKNIRNFEPRTLVQFLNAYCPLVIQLEDDEWKEFYSSLKDVLLEREAEFDLQQILGVGYNLLLLSPPENLNAYNNFVFNEIATAILKKKNFINQDFIFIYYIYLIYCHRIIRKAPKKELEKLQPLIQAYEEKILTHYSTSKKENTSMTESKVRSIIQKSGKFDEIDDVPLRVLPYGTEMSFLMMPNSKVVSILDSKQKLKGFAKSSLLLPYTVDILVNNYAIEINGPYHYIYDHEKEEHRINGYSLLKKELLEAIGLKYVEIPFWEIDRYLAKNENEGIINVVRGRMK